MKGKVVELELTEGAKIKVGTLEVDVTLTGIGRVLVDGQPLKVRRLTIDMEVGKVAKIVAELVPLPDKVGDEVTALGDQCRHRHYATRPHHEIEVIDGDGGRQY